MDIQGAWQVFVSELKLTGIWQWIAVLLGVAEVLLAKANKILLYPAGILASAISMYLLAEAGLYAECGLNGYYIVMSIYGWWHWTRKKDAPPVKITYCTKRDWQIVVVMTIAGYVLLELVLDHLTPSTVPELDALVSATAWVGTWLLAKRKIENWILLNISNIIAIPLLWHKQLPLFSLLTLFLFIVAVQGYFSWRKKIKEDGSSSVVTAER
jgi:nicotinamide mononucleotide transporter